MVEEDIEKFVVLRNGKLIEVTLDDLGRPVSYEDDFEGYCIDFANLF